MINVAVIEDNDTIREGLKILINETYGYSCSAAFSSYDLFYKEIKKLSIDVLLIDIGSSGSKGISAVKKIKTLVPETSILILTLYEENNLIFDALCAGASGYVVKRTPPGKLLEAIQEAYYGGTPMNSDIARKVTHFFQRQNQINSASQDLLSDGEQDILNKLIEGNSFKVISDTLLMSIEDMRFSFRNIYKKLHFRAQLK